MNRLIAADPDGEVTLLWTDAQDLMALYQLTGPARPVGAPRL